MYFGKDNKLQITEEEYDKLTPMAEKAVGVREGLHQKRKHERRLLIMYVYILNPVKPSVDIVQLHLEVADKKAVEAALSEKGYDLPEIQWMVAPKITIDFFTEF